MKLYEVFDTDLKTNVRFKILSEQETYKLVSQYKDATQEEFVRAVLEAVIYNLKAEVTTAIRKISKDDAKNALTKLFNCALMLNPGLDVMSWLQIASAPLLVSNYAQSPMLESGEKKTTRASRKRSSSINKISRTRFLNLERHLKDAVIGQDEAIEELVAALRRSHVGLNDEDRPLGVFVFAGASGVGKTLIAKELHKYLFGETEMVRVDCGEYQHKHENQKLLGCFIPGTAIQMADGRYKNIEDILIGETVISHTGKEQLVEKTFQYENINPMVSIRVANSNVPIITTAGHEILVAKPVWQRTRNTERGGTVSSDSYSKDNFQWVTASRLQKDDIVAFPRNNIIKEISTIDLWESVKERRYQKNDQYIWSRKGLETNRFIQVDETFARLAGYYIAEGGSSKSLKTFNFTFGITEVDYVEEVITLVHKIFGSNISYKVEKRATHNGEPNSWRVFFHSRAITILLANLFGKNTWEKHLPKELIYANENIQYNLLETAIFGDGSTSVKRRVQYDTVSRDLFSQLNFIFKRLGFTTQIQVHPAKNANWSTRYRIYLAGTQILQFSKRLPDLNIQLGGMGYTGIQRMSYVDEDYIYYQITGIDTQEYVGPVYDLKIAEDTSYCANGIAVHNSPPGYLGHDEGGQLTNAVLKNPHTVVLLDEVEKADPDMWNTFLRVFDEGWLTDSSGKKVSFHNAIIIMTTNLGNKDIVKDIQETKFGFQKDNSFLGVQRDRVIRVTNDAIRKYFRPEFLNRIDKTVVFNHLTHDNMKQIAELELGTVRNKLEKRGFILTYEDSVVDAMIIDGVDNVKGARGLSQIRRDRIENILASSLMDKSHPKGTVFRLDHTIDGYTVNVGPPTFRKINAKTEDAEGSAI